MPYNKVLTWQPRGRPGAYISVGSYNTVRDFIFQTLRAEDITLTELLELGKVHLIQSVPGDIAWNILIVKRDLEARGLIRNIVRWAPYKTHFLRLNQRVLKKYNRNLVQGNS